MAMYPGYADPVYASPIRVDALTPLGGRRFRLAFFNAGYAQGVQGFELTLRTLQRSGDYHAAVRDDADDARLHVFHAVDIDWLERRWPEWSQRDPIRAGEATEAWLNRRFGL